MILTEIDKIYIYSRRDRYGSNCLYWIPALFLKFDENKILCHKCNHKCLPRFKKYIIHNFLLNNSSKEEDGYALSKLSNPFIENLINTIIKNYNNTAFPDLFHNSITHKKILEVYDNMFKTTKLWSVPENINESIVIHLRMDDHKDHKVNTIEQEYIGDKKLKNLIVSLSEKFRNTNIYLLMHNIEKDVNHINNLISNQKKKLKAFKRVKLISNHYPDNDIYIMINSKILIMSKSTFALTAGLLSRQEKVFTYESWKHYEDLKGTDSVANPDSKFQIYNF